jgi:hypothetical protein
MQLQKMTKAQAAIHYAGLTGAARRLVQEMEGDNGGYTMCVTPKLAKRLQNSVELMQAVNIKFTANEVELIAAGDQDEAMFKFRNQPGYQEMAKILNAIFDPTDYTLCSYHAAMLEPGALYKATGK